MINKKNINWLLRSTFYLLFIVMGFPVYANESDELCQGEWKAVISTTPVERSFRDRGGLWFPAYIELSHAFRHCAKVIEIEPLGRSSDRIIKGPQNDVISSLFNSDRQPLLKNGKGNYQLPILGKNRVKFWLYIAKGKQLLPGLYSSEMMFYLGDTLSVKSERITSFKYVAKPYVNAKINSYSGRWLSYSGSTIRLDMGNLTKSNHRTIDFMVQSNTNVRVKLISENRGDLVNLDSSNKRIPYFVTVNGQKRKLSAPIEYEVRSFSKDKGEVLRIHIENQASPNAMAGIYQDMMTVSLFAQ
ncbi:hypothetical protein GNP84_14745 [Aliivibrio fischeri]|uniref:hypothetical protein n=1 Tax=Aliivibrio fischeri TaxID=668 RepID=UPI0012D8680C|nr:hypothetical protein [Aliivibrio fischeri]MUK78145.1 hypothetical protein [Aliivibrio fischeri]